MHIRNTRGIRALDSRFGNMIKSTYTRNQNIDRTSLVRTIPSMLVVEMLICFAFVLLLIENALQEQISDLFSYIDEIACLLFCAAACIKILSGRQRGVLSQHEKWVLLATVALCCVGLLGNVVYSVQPFVEAVGIDALTCIKFSLAYVSLCVILSDKRYVRLYDVCLIVSKVFVIIAFVCMLLNQFVGIGMSIEERFGIKAFMFVFGHPSNFAASIVGVSALLLRDAKQNRMYLAACAVILLSTMRFKAIAFVAVMILAMVTFRRVKRLTFTFLLLAAIVAIGAASYQLDIYLNGDTARGALLINSIKVANETFPLGTGFGTYGSDVTKEYYTSLYYQLGFNSVYGLTESNPIYLADMFYSTVLAQFGWIGFFIFLCVPLCFILGSSTAARRNEVFFWAVMSIPIYLLITSTTEPSFFSSYSVYLAFCAVAVARLPKISQREEARNSLSYKHECWSR